MSLLCGVLTTAAGCFSTRERIPLDPIPMREAVGIVNANTIKINGTLRAIGHVDGRFHRPNGRGIDYHVDGILFYLAPIYVRFDLKSFGERQFLLGSNAEYFWFYDKEADTYHCGRHDAPEDAGVDIPIPPDQIVDALGLTWIPEEVWPGDMEQQVQRVEDEYQQILVIERDDEGRPNLQKEYWLDRYAPRLVRRVLFRNAIGVVEMESWLNDYRSLHPGGPLLPHDMTASWPTTGDHMRFRVSRWDRVEEVGPDSIQFAAPRECASR